MNLIPIFIFGGALCLIVPLILLIRKQSKELGINKK